VIHADLFPDNVFFLGEKLSGLIDFYFACTDTLAYDVAICLNAWCFEPDHSYNVTKGRNLLGSYIKTRRLSAAELDALPLLARGAAMRFLLTRLVDWLNVPAGALVQPKNPTEYFRKLRFHQKIASVRDYGLTAEEARV
jgi:homoserine kinase type II